MVTMDISQVQNKAALTNVSLVKYVIYIIYFMIQVFLGGLNEALLFLLFL